MSLREVSFNLVRYHGRLLLKHRLALVLPLLAACSAAPGADEPASSTEDVAAQEQGLSCQGASCDGLLPASTQCKFDMQDTGLGAKLVDSQGRTIGGLGLFFSPSCQTVWASSSFYVASGPKNFRICTVRRRATENDPSCFDYSASYGNDAPMKYVPAGKSAFGKITVDGITTRTGDFNR